MVPCDEHIELPVGEEVRLALGHQPSSSPLLRLYSQASEGDLSLAQTWFSKVFEHLDETPD